MLRMSFPGTQRKDQPASALLRSSRMLERVGEFRCLDVRENFI
jgi:hypothetical protein